MTFVEFTVFLSMILCQAIPAPTDQSLPAVPRPDDDVVLACGPASLSIAFRLLGVEVVNGELALLADSTGESSFLTLAKYAESKGLWARALRMSPKQLLSLNDVAILQAIGSSSRNNGKRDYHFLVYSGHSEGEEVVLFNPIPSLGPRGPSPIQLLAEKWTGMALILSRAPSPATLGQRHLGTLKWIAMIAGTVASIAILLASRRRQPSTADSGALEHEPRQG